MAEERTDPKVYELMLAIRKFTRSSLMTQHLIAQKANLHVTDAECIDYLTEMGPSTAGVLAKATRLTTGAVTNLIDRLEKAGMVRRSADPKDRRKVVVSVVRPKRNVMSASYGNLAASVQEMLGRYNGKELELLIGYMRGLTEVFEGLEQG
jgi:DNA-binding MarR family transcriptional regulator